MSSSLSATSNYLQFLNTALASNDDKIIASFITAYKQDNDGMDILCRMAIDEVDIAFLEMVYQKHPERQEKDTSLLLYAARTGQTEIVKYWMSCILKNNDIDDLDYATIQQIRDAESAAKEQLHRDTVNLLQDTLSQIKGKGKRKKATPATPNVSPEEPKETYETPRPSASAEETNETRETSTFSTSRQNAEETHTTQTPSAPPEGDSSDDENNVVYVIDDLPPLENQHSPMHGAASEQSPVHNATVDFQWWNALIRLSRGILPNMQYLNEFNAYEITPLHVLAAHIPPGKLYTTRLFFTAQSTHKALLKLDSFGLTPLDCALLFNPDPVAVLDTWFKQLPLTIMVEIIEKRSLNLSSQTQAEIGRAYGLPIHQRPTTTTWVNLLRCNETLWKSKGNAQYSFREEQCQTLQALIDDYLCLYQILNYFSRSDRTDLRSKQYAHFYSEILPYILDKSKLEEKIRTHTQSLSFFQSYQASTYIDYLQKIHLSTIDLIQQRDDLLGLFDNKMAMLILIAELRKILQKQTPAAPAKNAM